MNEKQIFLIPIFIIVFFLFTIQCGQPRFEEELYIYSDKDGEITSQISQELNKREVPHEFDDKGAILYYSKDKDTVRKISKRIMAKFETETYIIFKDETLLKAFTNLLFQNDIAYQTIDLGNTDGVKIFWDPIYDSQVIEIKDEFFRTIYAKKPPVIKVVNDQILNNLEALLTEKGIYYKVVDCHSAIGGKCINYNSDDYKDIQDLRMIARDMARNKNAKEP